MLERQAELTEVPIHERFIPRHTSLETTGIQSEIQIGQIDGIDVIKKVAGGQLTLEQQETLRLAMEAYRQQLRYEGIAVPSNLSTRINGQGIEVIDELVDGYDVDVAIRMGEPLDDWREIVQTLCQLNSGGDKSRLMIDAKPANWIVNGQLNFIDLYPPTLRGEDGMLTPWVPELYKRSHRLFTFNYGDTRGQITKLLAGAKLTYPTRYDELKEVALNVVSGSLSGSPAEYIHEQVQGDFPDMNLFYKEPEVGEERLRELLQK
jgi:hypothetical protein